MRQCERRAWIWIDVSATCNLACELCYTTPMRSREKMRLSTFEKVMDRLASSRITIASLHLNWRGEPTSNTLLPEMIAHASAVIPDVEIEWHTNGTLISAALAQDLIAASSHQMIFVSLDGGTAESFERTRGRGTWPRALRGLEALLNARPSAPPRIGVYQLDLGVATEDYDPAFRDLLSTVDRHVVEKPVAPDGAIIGAYAPVPLGPCFWLGNALAIDATGMAHTCLLATATPLGSVLALEVDELLDRAHALRAVVDEAGRRVVMGCKTCRKPEGVARPA